MTFTEEERQALLLSLAKLSVERPGWENFLHGIACKMDDVIAGRARTYDKLREIHADTDTPGQAWYRGAALMRAAFHQHAKLAEDDPLWGIEIPEYRPPEDLGASGNG
jgi:hypothetical protein